MNERIKRLRKRFIESERHVDIERAMIITEVYQENEEKPQIIKRALALDAIFTRMTIEVRDDELIVGNHAKRCRGVPLFPEYAVDWILEDMDTFPTRKGDRFKITEEQKQTLRQVLPYWKGKCLRDKVKGALPARLKELLAYGVFTNENFTMSGPGHMVPDYEFVLQNGLRKIKEICLERIERMSLEDIEYEEKYNLYQSCCIVCDALIKFAQRYAGEAQRVAASESDDNRRKELLIIVQNCRRVPAQPAQNFHQALQCMYFLQLAIQMEANGLAISLGVPDQTLYPYYRKDVEQGALTEEKALELIGCFYLKLGELDKIYSNSATRYLQGPGHGQTITLGGVTREGRDATNELSHLFLLADRDIRLAQPDMAVRIHRTTPNDFLREVCINMKLGLAKPKLFNDEVVVESLLDLGVPLEDARHWGALGCSEPVVCGKTNSWGNSGHLNLAKCLELALNDGKCMLTSQQMGPHTGDPRTFHGFEELLSAFENQVRYFVKYLVLYDNIIDRFQAKEAPLPLYSIVIRDCLETGREFNRGGARYNTTSPLGVGPITTGDSLAAVKTLVYDERRLSMEQLLDALKYNFEGMEDIRQMLINRAPKFGNDDDRADVLCNTVLKIYCDEVRRYENPRNGSFIGALYYLTANIPFGFKTAATPDGRKAGEPLNDGGISPVHGRDRKGATAVAKSVGKLDMQRVPHGAVLNQRFHPSLLEGDEKLGRFMQYLRTYMDLGGWETQFNMVTSDILRDAQRHPENYRDLVIRVAGYSAFFTQLEVELQNDIMERTEKMAY
ncbi:MAG: glycyl radical protein [Deltaproteobacteria bacterium]|nr:glycyl radical protein [Deltaproteobacteria bacterium]